MNKQSGAFIFIVIISLVSSLVSFRTCQADNFCYSDPCTQTCNIKIPDPYSYIARSIGFYILYMFVIYFGKNYFEGDNKNRPTSNILGSPKFQ